MESYITEMNDNFISGFIITEFVTLLNKERECR